MDWDALFADEPAPVDRIEVSRVQADPMATQLSALLDEFFPHSKGPSVRHTGPLALFREVGEHMVGFLGMPRVGDSGYDWCCVWKVIIGAVPRGRASRRAWKDMEKRPLIAYNGAVAWLFGLRGKIHRWASETVRIALDPDNFMPNPLQAFASSYDLRLFGFKPSEVADMVQIPLPWKASKSGREAVLLFRKSGRARVDRIGTIGFGFKDSWRWGVSLDTRKLDGLFVGAPEKWTGKADPAMALNGDTKPEKIRAIVERFYVEKTVNWMMQYSVDERLRTVTRI